MIQDIDPENDRIEPEKMSDEDIKAWLVTCRDTLVVLRSEEAAAFSRIYDDFILDLKTLQECGRIDQEEMIKIIEEIEDQL